MWKKKRDESFMMEMNKLYHLYDSINTLLMILAYSLLVEDVPVMLHVDIVKLISL